MPRQARDKHREKSFRTKAFCADVIIKAGMTTLVPDSPEKPMLKRLT